MERKISSTAATAALIACSVCHVWALLQLLRDFLEREQERFGSGPGLPCMLLYLGAVCLFNWFALTSESRAYRRLALAATTIHLSAALLQGAAAWGVLMSGQRRAGGLLELGVKISSALNLPLDSAGVVGDPGSFVPWLISFFFAVNLAMVLIRLRRFPQ